MSWMFGYCDSGDVKDILIVEAQSDMDAMDLSADFAEAHRFVSGTYPSMSKQEMREAIVKDGWWFKDGDETEDDGFPYGEKEEEGIGGSINVDDILRAFDYPLHEKYAKRRSEIL